MTRFPRVSVRKILRIISVLLCLGVTTLIPETLLTLWLVRVLPSAYKQDPENISLHITSSTMSFWLSLFNVKILVWRQIILISWSKHATVFIHSSKSIRKIKLSIAICCCSFSLASCWNVPAQRVLNLTLMATRNILVSLRRMWTGMGIIPCFVEFTCICREDL
jgi:hypothetical protein